MTATSIGRRGVAGAIAAAVLVAGLLVAALASGGSSQASGPSGPLAWNDGAFSFEHETLEGDFIASGDVSNHSGAAVRLVATRDVKVVDEDGNKLPSSAVFSQTVGHGLFDPTRVPKSRLPEGELRRIGDVGMIKPGNSVPLTVSWHESGAHGVRIEYPGGSLPVP